MKTLAKIGRARALVRYFRDREASILGKLFVLAAVVYVISPVDLIPDAFPIVGWLDDMGVMSLAVAWMWKVVGRYREAPQLASATREDRRDEGSPRAQLSL
ncbi:MAG: hypothetical protein JWO86_1497 [Myxococcaceae bacterium]|jgi:uncharacterized membrane protein YkvA (DUF1232 family)|nr:hypothetical protein [Myxococcaceae bacterium]MEA2748097.1 hypothetical protein [Myxococcales bacterium]